MIKVNKINKLDPEIEEGNIEYKRYLINVNPERLEELATQMNWRLKEGNNQAIYYFGVDDDGTPYTITNNEKIETLKNFNLLLEKNNAEITKFIIKNGYFKIDIKRKTVIYPECRVVLLGDSLSGKTTFLSNILLDKIDGKSEARIYLLNHKHEIESKKTSSINCFYKIHNGIKFIFMESPGSIKYKRTKYKILLSVKPNICLLFMDKNENYNKFDKFLMDQLKIPYLMINTFNTTSEYNCKKIINKEILFNSILSFNIASHFEANHNKDYSVVKTSKAGGNSRFFFAVIFASVIQ